MKPVDPEALVTALRFYADGRHYHGDVLVDRGQFARNALAGLVAAPSKSAGVAELIERLRTLLNAFDTGWRSETPAWDREQCKTINDAIEALSPSVEPVTATPSVAELLKAIVDQCNASGVTQVPAGTHRPDLERLRVLLAASATLNASRGEAVIARLRACCLDFECPPSIQSQANIRAINAMNEAADMLAALEAAFASSAPENPEA